MNLIALLIGLVVERLATHLFHLRRLRWLERVIDAGFRQAGRLANWPALVPVILLVLLLALPVAVAVFGVTAIPEESGAFAYMLLAIVVLFFSFGPKDIGEDVDEYCKALEDGDQERIEQTARALIEGEVPADPLARIHAVEAAVCVQANNRLFAVIFWFIVVGPLGAWIYRLTDLVRRRAVFNAARAEEEDPNAGRMLEAALTLHGWLAWIPARLTAIGYATAGHFDAALGAWRAPTEESDESLAAHNEHLLARVGTSALALEDDDEEDLDERGIRGATAANRLVFRLFLIAAVVISAMTLYGLTQ
ncbi:MAG: regulatory signaling modulator protein AmpE [Woeseiaceae bacterium]|nr:regulatory signaling modulator protein AmpE [Woeseiaceae bacterium]